MDWRVVPGHTDYEISDSGDIRRRFDGKNRAYKAGRMLQTTVNQYGYRRVHLKDNGVSSYHSVHRLVCLAFIGQPPPGCDHVAHFDGDKLNNNVTNLRWATCRENIHDKKRHGRWVQGEKQGGSKLRESDVLKILSEYNGRRGQTTELARKYGVSIPTISAITTGRNWRHLSSSAKEEAGNGQ